MLIPILVGAAGVLLLAIAPDRFVAGSAGLADIWGMPRVMVGVLVIGFGTSAPEMLVSGLSAGQGDPQVGIGNIIGSNVANLSLILGVAALVGTMAVPRGIVRGEIPLLLLGTLGFAVAVQDGISRAEGGVLAVAMVVVLVMLGLRARRPTRAEEEELDAEVEEYLEEEEAGGLRKLVVDAVAGLAGTVAGAQLLVTGAVGIADELDLSGGFVGMTVVAIGTSLPELVTAVAAARSGEDQLILGNLIGSNLFNSLAVGAIVGLVSGGAIDDTTLTVGGVALMLGVTGVATVSMLTGVVTRLEAVGLLVIYAVAMPLLA